MRVAPNASLPQPLVPGMSVLQRKENLWSGLPLHCSCSLGWGGMSLLRGWQSSGSRSSMLKIPWCLCRCCLAGLQLKEHTLSGRVPHLLLLAPFLGLLEALLWCSSEQAAFGWSMRSAPSPTAALPTAHYLLFSLPWLPWCTAGEWYSLRSCPSDSPTQKSH